MAYYEVTIVGKKKEARFPYLATEKGLKALQRFVKSSRDTVEYHRAWALSPEDKEQLKQSKKGYISKWFNVK